MKTNAFWWSLFVVAAICVVCMNVFCIPGHDELFYAFKRMESTGDACPRLASFADLVQQQIWDYNHYNARVFLHGIVSFFSAFRLYYLFDIINAGAWLLLVLLIYKEAIGRPFFIDRYMAVFAFVFMFWWYAETTCKNAAFGVNYLWVAVATVTVMRAWRDLNAWWWVPVGFLYGWSHEGFSVPMAVALTGSIIVRSVVNRHYWASLKQSLFVVAVSLGAACIVLSPAVRARADASVRFDMGMALRVARALAGCVVALWPFLLFVCVLILFISVLKSKRREIVDNCEWWLYFFATFGLFVISSKNGLYRLTAPCSLAGIVLLLKAWPVSWMSRHVKLCSVAVIVYLLGGTALQVSYGIENWRMLERYRNSPSGITWRSITPPLWYDNMCSYERYVFHLSLFQWDIGSMRPMSILPEELYMDLSENAERFFNDARELPRVGLYVHADYPGLVVKRGRMDEVDRKYLKENVGSLPCSKLPFYLPGRVQTMLAHPMIILEMAKDEVEWSLPSGKVVTLVRY